MFSISKRPTISEIHNLYKNKKALPSQVTQFFLNRIKDTDDKINSFFKTSGQIGIDQARVLDQKLEIIWNLENELESLEKYNALLDKMPLFGIPFATKAIIMAEGEVFNASSLVLNNFIAPYSSTVYEKTINSGGVLIGVNNMDEFAMGASGETCAYGVIKNPIDTTRVPGGSSAGAAASVSGGMVVFALATDTGGSIRQPACFTDTVGIKPTYGMVSRHGVIPMASSFDQVGPISNNVEDNLIVLRVLSGRDKKDQTTIDSQQVWEKMDNLYKKRKKTDRQISTISKTYKPLLIGIPSEFYPSKENTSFNPEILSLLEDLKLKLGGLGHKFVPVSLPLTKYAISVYYITMSVEVASNLERMDGIRYGMQKKDGYQDLFFDHRGQYFGEEAKRRIMLGTFASSSGYYDAYYNRAQKVRELARRDFENAFKKCDLMLVPTTPELPFKLGQKSSDPLSMYLSDVFTCGINPVRIPGLNVPIGFASEIDKENGKKMLLPTGCQILGPELSEDLLYELAFEIETLQKELRVI